MFGVQDLASAMQKGGRAGQSPSISACMVWIVEKWAFDLPPPIEGNDGKPETKAKKDERNRCEGLDPATCTFINCSDDNLCSDECMWDFAVEHFSPKLRLPGFEWFNGDEGAEGDVSSNSVDEQARKPSSSRKCAILQTSDGNTVINGQLNNEDHKRIDGHVSYLHATSHPSLANPDTPKGSSPSHPTRMEHIRRYNALNMAPTVRCSHAEHAILHNMVCAWRDNKWDSISAANPFLSPDWVISDKNIDRLVDKAHVLLGCQEVDVQTIRSFTQWPLVDDNTIGTLIKVIEDFHNEFEKRKQENEKERASKRLRTTTSLFSPVQLTSPTKSGHSLQIAMYQPLIDAPTASEAENMLVQPLMLPTPQSLPTISTQLPLQNMTTPVTANIFTPASIVTPQINFAGMQLFTPDTWASSQHGRGRARGQVDTGHRRGAISVQGGSMTNTGDSGRKARQHGCRHGIA
uniref:Putative P-loop containing nucleoside triphosphate hydrolase protein n=1 Tax=Moniliophthora roreri TaxID=221103 RepID=A0A0W0F4I0_MONRR